MEKIRPAEETAVGIRVDADHSTSWFSGIRFDGCDIEMEAADDTPIMLHRAFNIVVSGNAIKVPPNGGAALDLVNCGNILVGHNSFRAEESGEVAIRKDDASYGLHASGNLWTGYESETN